MKLNSKKIKKSQRPQTVMLQKVIVLENDSYKIIGSGYMIHKRGGYTRLDAMDLKGNHLEEGNYQISVQNTYLAYTTDLIQ